MEFKRIAVSHTSRRKCRTWHCCISWDISTAAKLERATRAIVRRREPEERSNSTTTENKPTTSNKLTVIDGETLMEKRIAPTKFCVETLIPQGLCILAGAPKIGKSWLVLDLCVKVAKGESFLGQPTIKGTVLYLCLEDSLRRIQERLCNIADEVPANVFFATQAGTMESGLEDQIRSFTAAYPDLSLVVIDTFPADTRDKLRCVIRVGL